MRLVLLAAIVTSVIIVLMVAIPWLRVLTPRWLIRGTTIAYLWSLLAVCALAAPAVLIGGVWALLAAARSWRRNDRAALRRAFRRLLLATSGLVGLIAMELACETMLHWSHRIPDLPTRFAVARGRETRVQGGPLSTKPDQASASGENWNEFGKADQAIPAGDELYLVVVGESSARGEPYQPWLSVGQVLGWQLERLFPSRRIRVDVRADGGICLELAILRLADLDQRPDAIIVFAGHNEFQARYGWSRNVRHYVEEGPESPLALLELARATSSTAKLILITLDRFYGETPAPRRATRELVDHPICSPTEYAFLREDFHRRLDALASYCERIGSLLILIVPASNDGAFEPSRSVLAGSTPAAQRAAFAREFQAAHATESDDTEASAAAYRRLLEQHPEFAESHYRLARLLGRAEAWAEAREHFILARDLDGLPLRCPTDFRAAYQAVARRHGSLLIDGPELLSRLSPHGILDDHLFHDGQHLNLVGTAALAQDLLEQLRHRRAFGWPESTPVPRIDLEECARHFKLDAEKWATVSERTSVFFSRTAYVRFDPTERLSLAGQYAQAALDLAAGRPLREPVLPSLDIASWVLQGARTPVPASKPRSSP